MANLRRSVDRQLHEKQTGWNQEPLPRLYALRQQIFGQRTRQHEAEVSAYMEQYRRRNPLAFLKHELGMKTTQRLRSYVLSGAGFPESGHHITR